MCPVQIKQEWNVIVSVNVKRISKQRVKRQHLNERVSQNKSSCLAPSLHSSYEPSELSDGFAFAMMTALSTLSLVSVLLSYILHCNRYGGGYKIQNLVLWEELLYLVNCSKFTKVSELLKRRSVTFQRRRRSLLSDCVHGDRQTALQYSQILSSWLRSLWNSGSSTNVDLVVSRSPTESVVWLHSVDMFRLLASSENCSDRQHVAFNSWQLISCHLLQWNFVSVFKKASKNSSIASKSH